MKDVSDATTRARMTLAPPVSIVEGSKLDDGSPRTRHTSEYRERRVRRGRGASTASSSFLRDQKRLVRRRKAAVERVAAGTRRARARALESAGPRREDVSRRRGGARGGAPPSTRRRRTARGTRVTFGAAAVRSAKHGGAALAAAFSETVMTSARGRRAGDGSLPSAAGLAADAVKLGASHQRVRAFKTRTGHARHSSGDDAARALRHALFTVRRARATRHDASAHTLSMQRTSFRGRCMASRGVWSRDRWGATRGGLTGFMALAPAFTNSVDRPTQRVIDRERRYRRTASGWRSSGKPSARPARVLNELAALGRRATYFFYSDFLIRRRRRQRPLPGCSVIVI